MKTRKFLNLIICLCCISLLTACQNTNSVEGNETLPSAQTVISSNETQAISPETTSPAETTPPDVAIIPDSERVLYVSMSTEDLSNNQLNISSSLNVQSITVIDMPLKNEVKENISSKQIKVGKKAEEFVYQHSYTSEISSDIVDRFISYDHFSRKDGRQRYAFHADGTLNFMSMLDHNYGESKEALPEETAIQLAKNFLTEWYGGIINIDDYHFSVSHFISSNPSPRSTPITFVNVYHGNSCSYDLPDNCRFMINSDGMIIDFDSKYLGSSYYFTDVTEEHYAAAREYLINAADDCGADPDIDSVTTKLGNDGKLYMYLSAITWTYDDMGMLTEDSHQIEINFCTCVNP